MTWMHVLWRAGRTLVPSLVVAVMAAMGWAGTATGAPVGHPARAMPGSIVPARGTRGAGVLIVGDSTALTLGLALGDWSSESRDGLVLTDEAQFGCGIAEGYFIISGGARLSVPAACNPGAPPVEQWPSLLRCDLLRYRPRVVVMLAGRWEVFDRTDRSGQVTNITKPSYARYIEQEMQDFVTIATSTGSRVILLTAPYYAPTGSMAGHVPPEDDPVRVDDYNRLLHRVAEANRRTTSLFDLNAIVSAHGRFTFRIGTQVVRTPDGIHFPFFSLVDVDAHDPDTLAQVLQFSRWLGPKLLPFVARTAALPSG
jgi:hypothetical protein